MNWPLSNFWFKPVFRHQKTKTKPIFGSSIIKQYIYFNLTKILEKSIGSQYVWKQVARSTTQRTQGPGDRTQAPPNQVVCGNSTKKQLNLAKHSKRVSVTNTYVWETGSQQYYRERHDHNSQRHNRIGAPEGASPHHSNAGGGGVVVAPKKTYSHAKK